MQLFDEEKPIAKSYIHRADDERNVCFLTTMRLVINRRGKSYDFLLSHLVAVSLRDRKILFPIVFGGILFSLSVVAISTDDYHPLILLTTLLAGLALLYFGFTGMKAISVIESKAEINFFLINYNASLEQFLEFVNRYIQRHEGSIKYYLPITGINIEASLSKGTRIYEHYEIMESFEGQTLEVLEIDASSDGVPIRYILDNNAGSYYPVLDEDILSSQLKRIHMSLRK